MNNPVFIPSTPRRQAPQGPGPAQPPLYPVTQPAPAPPPVAPPPSVTQPAAMNMNALGLAAQQATLNMNALAQASATAAQAQAAGGMNLSALAASAATAGPTGWAGLSQAGQAQAARVDAQKKQAAQMAALAEAAIPTAQLVTTADVGDVKGATIDRARAQMEDEAKATKEAEDLDRARRLIDKEYDYRRQKEEEAKKLRDEDNKAAEARKAQTSGGDQALSTTDPFLRKAQQDANQAARAKEEAGRVDRARRGIDPEYAKQAATMDVRRGVGQAQVGAMAAQQAGVPGAGAVGNVLQGAQMGASVGGPAGAAVGAAAAAGLELKKTIEGVAESAGEFGKAIAAGDVGAFHREIANAAKQIPLFGEGIAKQVNLVTGVNAALAAEADRIKGFSAALSMNAARIDVERTQRDMDRAQRFGPELMAAQNSAARAEEQMYELQIKYLPTIARFAEVGMKMMEQAVDFLSKQLDANVRLAEILSTLPGLPPQVRDMVNNLRRLVQNTDPNAEAFEADDFTTQLLNTVAPFMANQEERDRAQRLRQQEADERQARGELFPNL